MREVMYQLANSPEVYDAPDSFGCQAAVQTSKLSTHTQYNVGAAVIGGGRLLSLGHNKGKTSPYIGNKFRHRGIVIDKNHAEIEAVIKARTDLRGAKMFVARSNKVGLAMARPCMCCMEVIEMAGIREIIYTAADGSWLKERV